MLNGIVDAAVSGGVSNYGPFLNGNFVDTHPEILEDLKQKNYSPSLTEVLSHLLVRQSELLAEGIDVHAIKCVAAMLPLHQHMLQRHAQMVELLQQLGVLTKPTLEGEENSEETSGTGGEESGEGLPRLYTVESEPNVPATTPARVLFLD